MFNHTITVVTSYTSNDKLSTNYSVAKLKGVHLVTSIGVALSSNLLHSEDSTKVLIPPTVKSDKVYINVDLWRQADDGIKRTKYTLGTGTIVVKGDIAVTESNVTKLKESFADVFEVTSISNFDFGDLKHIKLICK